MLARERRADEHCAQTRGSQGRPILCRFGDDTIYGQYFPGTIDQIRIYNPALSATELQSDTNNHITPRIYRHNPSTPVAMDGRDRVEAQCDENLRRGLAHRFCFHYSILQALPAAATPHATLTPDIAMSPWVDLQRRNNQAAK